MIFKEIKTEQGYTYDTEDIFGTVHIESVEKLNGELLDDMVLLLLKQNISAETVTGEVKYEKGIVKYTFKKTPTWSEDEECEDIPTSTKKQAEGFTQILYCPIKIYSWLKKFVEVFREVWRKTNNK